LSETRGRTIAALRQPGAVTTDPALADIRVPSASVHRIQEAQTTVYHVLWELTLAGLSGD
jgi:hypothetical protein